MSDQLPKMEPGDPPPASPPPASSARRRSAWRRAATGLVIVAAVVGGVALWLLRPAEPQQRSGGRFGNGGPMPVVAVAAQKGDIPVQLNGLGTVTALATVTVQTQINGQLTAVGFQEGQVVKQGDFLAQIDPRPYQVALEQAQAQLAHDQAVLLQARMDLERYRKLAAQESIAKQTYEDQIYIVQQDEGTVKVDQALIDSAKLNLTYCHIVSPVTGRAGLRLVDPGNYIQTSSATGIVTVTQTMPITVVFPLPEDNLPAILNRLHAGASLAVTAFDRSNSAALATGTLMAIDSSIDTTTGTVKLKARFDNSDEVLFPNQFVNAQLLVDTLHDVTVVPTAAIQRGAPGTFVYLVKPDSTVTVRPVKLGPSAGDRVAVQSGLEPGDKVVVDGADKLREGAKVSEPADKGQATGHGHATASGSAPGNAAGGAAPANGGRRHGGQGSGQGSGPGADPGRGNGGPQQPRGASPP